MSTTISQPATAYMIEMLAAVDALTGMLLAEVSQRDAELYGKKGAMARALPPTEDFPCPDDFLTPPPAEATYQEFARYMLATMDHAAKKIREKYQL